MWRLFQGHDMDSIDAIQWTSLELGSIAARGTGMRAKSVTVPIALRNNAKLKSGRRESRHSSRPDGSARSAASRPENESDDLIPQTKTGANGYRVPPGPRTTLRAAKAVISP
jgi:hypothetical protein